MQIRHCTPLSEERGCTCTLAPPLATGLTKPSLKNACHFSLQFGSILGHVTHDSGLKMLILSSSQILGRWRLPKKFNFVTWKKTFNYSLQNVIFVRKNEKIMLKSYFLVEKMETWTIPVCRHLLAQDGWVKQTRFCILLNCSVLLNMWTLPIIWFIIYQISRYR